MDDLVSRAGTDNSYRLRNPQKKSFNRMLRDSKARVLIRCSSRPDMPQLLAKHRDLLKVCSLTMTNMGAGCTGL